MCDNNVEYSDGFFFYIGDIVVDIGVKVVYDLYEGEVIVIIFK